MVYVKNQENLCITRKYHPLVQESKIFMVGRYENVPSHFFTLTRPTSSNFSIGTMLNCEYLAS